MSMNPKSRPPIGRQPPTPPRGVKKHVPATDPALPHERDEATAQTAAAPDAGMVQAKRDLDAGMVDTDMRATPGLDADRRADLVPGPGGKPHKHRR